MQQRIRISRANILRLAAEASRDPMTVRNVIEGRGNSLSRASVLEAAKRLGYSPNDPLVVFLSAEREPPPSPSSSRIRAT